MIALCTGNASCYITCLDKMATEMDFLLLFTQPLVPQMLLAAGRGSAILFSKRRDEKMVSANLLQTFQK
ncbi:Uncharacterized protein APZ42_013977 [Daphnia magna]|uniref:Uncharacterized protein n=1 Tax=Daphnia magna TaxID=35525 RepID=A0A162QB12_9CRUS|nr:Uncharacterized protein APZ42_013977 [Daphnia magna]